MKASNANKVISVLLSVAMCPMMVPSAAFAAEDDAASGASSPSEQTQPADQAEGVDVGASSSDTIAPQSEATGEATDEAAGEAAPAAAATVNGYSTLEEAVRNATADAQGVITYEVTGKVNVDSTGWVQVRPAAASDAKVVKFVGKNANVILKAAGLEVDESVDLQLAVILTDSVDHPYVMCEQLMPIFPICKVKDWDAAMAAAIKAEAGCHHSACVWTASLERATALGKALGCTCFAMNGPTVGGTGMMGTGYGSPTIAVSTGEGFTTPNTFTRFRRFAMCQGAAYMG